MITVRLDREISQVVALLRTNYRIFKEQKSRLFLQNVFFTPFLVPSKPRSQFHWVFLFEGKKRNDPGIPGWACCCCCGCRCLFVVLRKSVRTENLCPLDPVDDLTLEDAGHDAEDAAGGGGVEITTPEATLRPQLRNEERDPGCRGLYYPLL